MIDQDMLKRFKLKDYRDSYMSGRVRTSIALQIRQIREFENLLQSEFAQKIGTRQSGVSRLENTEYGKVRVQTLLDIACEMGVALVVKFVSYDDFFSLHGDITPDSLHAETFSETYKRRTNIPDNRAVSTGLESQIAGRREPLRPAKSQIEKPRGPRSKLAEILSDDTPTPLKSRKAA